MKKLLFILFLLPVLCFGQGRFPYSNTAHISSGGGSYTTEYQAVLDAMTTDPTGDTLTWQNSMVSDLVDDGYWDRMDVLYIMATTDNGDDEALINWINPGTFDATEVSSPTWTNLEGYAGSGGYLTTNYNPYDDAINWTQNSATIGVYIRNNVEESTGVFGRNTGSSASYILPYYSGAFRSRINDESSQSSSTSDSRGTLFVTRTASNALELYQGGSSVLSATDVSSGVTDGNFYILTRDGSAISTHQVSIAFAMDGISDTDAAGINTIIETYMDAIGKGVQ